MTWLELAKDNLGGDSKNMVWLIELMAEALDNAEIPIPETTEEVN